MTTTQANPENGPDLSAKYSGEARNVAQLLEKNSTEAKHRLELDSHIAPHEMHTFLKQMSAAYGADKAKNPNLPDLEVTDDKTGIKVALRKPGDNNAQTIFERTPEQLAKAGDKPIPLTGQLLNLSPEQTKQILDIQAAEKEKAPPGSHAHKFGDIAVSLGFKTPEEVNAALEKQDHLKAAQMAQDLSKSMPLAAGEGYKQMVIRTHPELASLPNGDSIANHMAHTIKKNNGGKIHLHAGDQLPTLDPKQQANVEAQLYESLHTKTGSVKAHFNQPLSEIPIE